MFLKMKFVEIEILQVWGLSSCLHIIGEPLNHTKQYIKMSLAKMFLTDTNIMHTRTRIQII